MGEGREARTLGRDPRRPTPLEKAVAVRVMPDNRAMNQGLGAIPLPLRIPARWFWPIALGLGLLGLALVATSPFYNFIDFPFFWSGGQTAGTPDLFDAALRAAWGAAHGLYLSPWVYPPGAAWLFVPFGLFPLPVAFWLHAAANVLLVAASGLLGARVYGLDRRLGLVLAFAWTPCIASAIYGQNAPLALFLCLVTIEGLRRDSDWLAGLGAGLLLYKPTLALPLLGLLVLRLRWRALLVVAVSAAAWYLAGVAAAVGDWGWPLTWLTSVGGWYQTDTAHNIVRTISMSGVLQGFGVPSFVALGLGLVMAVLALPRLARAPLTEAAAGVVLVWLAVSPHALNYEGALVLPVLLWALGGSGTGLREPARTWMVVGAIVLAPEYLFSETLGLSSLALITVAGSIVWIAGWWRLDAASRLSPEICASDLLGRAASERNG